MVSEILLFGFIGGLARAVAGFMNYGVRSAENSFWRLLLLGFAGVVCAYAIVSVFPTKYWLFILASGYAGVDLLKSFYEIAGRVTIRI